VEREQHALGSVIVVFQSTRICRQTRAWTIHQVAFDAARGRGDGLRLMIC